MNFSYDICMMILLSKIIMQTSYLNTQPNLTIKLHYKYNHLGTAVVSAE